MSNLSSDNNKRIAKNTLLLYFRTLFVMAISLYTSRAILNTLGVEDFGIYNVVGGIVSMFGFIYGSMITATSRFITFALGKGDKEKLSMVFSIALQAHIAIAIILVILAEIIGVWFLYHKMQIPPDRMNAAFWVLQCSIIDMVIMLVSVPYSSVIVAHERMSAFAYISILETVMKLVIVYLLLLSPFDKLIVYAVLLLLVQVIIRFCNSIYCNHHFEETKYRHVWDITLFREITNFAGWSVFGNLQVFATNSGVNMLLNIFFGPVVNAARGVALQVQGAMQQFVGGFQTALNPQITKMYAKGEMAEMHLLMFRSARFSFFLLFFLSLPVFFEAEFVLRIWLKIVPENTVIFLRIIICTSLLYTIANPMMIANKATGKIKTYEIVCGTTLIMVFPISYVALKLGLPAYSVFVVHFVMECFCQLARMIVLRPLIGLRIRDYVEQVYSKIFIVVVLSSIFPLVVFCMMSDTVLRFFIVCFVSVVSCALVTYYLGMTTNEKVFIVEKAKNVILKFRH